MENSTKDYQLLYEQALSEQQQSLEQLKTLALDYGKSLVLLAQKDNEIAALSLELDKYRRYLFGKKSEKLSLLQTPGNQTDLFELGTSLQEQQELSAQSTQAPLPPAERKIPKKRAKGTGRTLLPEQLRREIIVIEPKEDVSDCVCIGEEVTEVLELIPAELYVKRYVRPKYARSQGEGILIGELPERIIDKGIPSEGLLAAMLIDKYVFGLPLHRQIDKYRRLGVTLPASTVSDWMLKSYRQLLPLWTLLQMVVVNQQYLQADESPLKVLDRDHSKGIHQGYLWVYQAPADKLVLFDYRKGRDSSGPQQLLEHFRGILQTDGYSVYESLYGQHEHVLLVYCMAHARRKFVEALKYDKVRASYMLEQMALLYGLEKELRETGADWQQRTQRRQQEAVPILTALKEWLQENYQQVLPKSPIGQAIAYALPRWEGLSAYALHGQIEIDNNLTENAIRPFAIGRKNFLFAGSHEAAQMTAVMYSLMATCKKNEVDELEWLKDVLERIQSHKQKDLYQLLPNNWKNYRNPSLP